MSDLESKIIGEDFPEGAQTFLNALYAGQKNGAVKTDEEKIALLRSILKNSYITSSRSLSELRKIYEFAYLSQTEMI